jgi:quinolinate synthase
MKDILEAAQPLIELAIAEDIGPGDATSESTLPADLTLHGRIVAKAHGVIAGLSIAQAVFERVDPTLCFTPHVEDGTLVSPGDLVAEVVGPARGMLAAERIALNFLQHLSGIASLARRFADATSGTSTTVLDTRKTHPGYRELEKYAVRAGGAQNHRMSLHDMILIKDNHIDGAGSIIAAVQGARAAHPDLPIEVEVKDMSEFREALGLGLDRIMLDNMDLDQIRTAVELAAGEVPLEVSGNVTLERVAEIAATGVDYVSVGALTHSAQALDLSMRIGSPETGLTSEVESRIWELKEQLGDQLVILGHHYQKDEVFQFADFRGDSLKLARDGAACRDANYIVFCGVHFMAETAAILAQPGQTVLLPDLEAGCPLAHMADLPLVEKAWAELAEVLDVENQVMPITYVNSAADLKAFCGQHGGSVCTSSNAEDVLRWALKRRERVLFFPDQHLGRNTAKRMGIPLEQMLLWDPRQPLGGHTADDIAKAKIFLWRGWCHVHQRFKPEHVQMWREQEPDIQVIVHPECTMEVVDLADEDGSTSYIIHRVKESPPGSKWAVGTEFNLVNRLAQENPDKLVVSLSPEPSRCRTMNLITVQKLARTLEEIASGDFQSTIAVPEDVARHARVALERMLEVGR